MEGSGWSGAGRKRLVGGEQNMAAEVSDDGGALVLKWQRKEAEELRWREVELLGCSEGAERHWCGGFTESRSSPELKGEEQRRYAGDKAWLGFI